MRPLPSSPQLIPTMAVNIVAYLLISLVHVLRNCGTASAVRAQSVVVI